MDLRLFTSQATYKVYLCPDAWDDLIGTQFRPTQPGQQAGVVGLSYRSRKASVISLFTRITKYANTGRLHAPEQVNSEGNGFSAIKHREGLRAYFWVSGSNMIISHFVYKKKWELAQSDANQMAANKQQYEAGVRNNGNRYIEDMA